MVINTNISAMSSARLLSDSTALLSKSLARLSSGSKFVSPEDDAAGQAVSLRFDAQINRISAAKTNVTNAISFSQTQDGFLQKVGKALDRMSELSILSQDVTKSGDDRALYDEEFQTLAAYIGETADKDFNGVSLFAGTTDNVIEVTTDSEGATFDMTRVAIGATDYTNLTDGTTNDITTTQNASAALTAVRTAIDTLASDRATIGANVARLSYTSDQLSILRDNLSAANSRMKDVDVAEESTQFARYNILVQAGTAMLAQANANPQSALRLLS